MPKRVLIVEDEDDVVQLVALHLRQAGYGVLSAGDCRAADAELRRELPDLVVLDLGLPDEPGTELCRRLRRDPRTARLPIVVLSARSEEIDRVVAFELGVDDYITKPFSPRELVLRVAAVLRRQQEAPPSSADRVVVGDIVIDVPRHRASIQGRVVDLTRREFALLLDLALHRGRVQTREALLARVWEDDGQIDVRTVDTHVKRLREKLGNAGECIETVRGVGYRMTETDEPRTTPRSVATPTR